MFACKLDRRLRQVPRWGRQLKISPHRSGVARRTTAALFYFASLSVKFASQTLTFSPPARHSERSKQSCELFAESKCALAHQRRRRWNLAGRVTQQLHSYGFSLALIQQEIPLVNSRFLHTIPCEKSSTPRRNNVLSLDLSLSSALRSE